MRPPRPAALARLTLLASLASVALAACGGDADVPAADSALARDLTLATAAPPATAPVSLADTAVAPEPRPAPPAPAPEPAPARRAPTRVAEAPRTPPRATVLAPAPVAAVPAVDEAPTPALPAARPAGPSFGRGTTLAGTTGSRLCSGSNAPGDRLVATLTGEATGADGTVLPAGTGVVLEVARVSPDGRVELIARGVSLRGTFHPIVADVAVGEAALEKRTVEGTGDGKGKAVKGAIAGAILGQILGRDTRSTVIGAAGGAAAGAAAGQLSKKKETCLPAGAPVTITLADAVTLH